MKKIVFTMFLLLFGNVVAAQEISLVSNLRTAFLGSNGAIFYDGPVLQNDLTIKWSSGVITELSTSSSDGSKGDFGDEISLMVGYSGEMDSINYTFGARYIDAHGIDVLKANADVSYGLLFVNFEYYHPAETGGPGKGLLSSAGFRYGLSVSDKWELNVETYGLHDTGTFGLEDGTFLMGSTDISYDVLKPGGLKFKTGAEFSFPVSNDDERSTQVEFFIGLYGEF